MEQKNSQIKLPVAPPPVPQTILLWIVWGSVLTIMIAALVQRCA